MTSSRSQRVLGKHIHHWRLPEPDGPTSLGTCSCGDARPFKNYVDGEDVIEDAFLSDLPDVRRLVERLRARPPVLLA